MFDFPFHFLVFRWFCFSSSIGFPFVFHLLFSFLFPTFSLFLFCFASFSFLFVFLFLREGQSDDGCVKNGLTCFFWIVRWTESRCWSTMTVNALKVLYRSYTKFSSKRVVARRLWCFHEDQVNKMVKQVSKRFIEKAIMPLECKYRCGTVFIKSGVIGSKLEAIFEVIRA